MEIPVLKPLAWIASSKKDLKEMPAEVMAVMGYALHLAQQGGKRGQAKPLQGYGSAGVLEVMEDDDGNTYRAVYTVKFKNAVYVLHCFQKKSRKGISTPKQEMDLVLKRLEAARLHSEGEGK